MTPPAPPARPRGVFGRLARAGAAVGVLKGASAALALFLAWALSRLLGPAEYGVYAYVHSLAVIVATLGALGVPGLLIREVAALREQGRTELLGALLRWGIVFATGASLVAATAMIFVGRAIDRGDVRADWSALGAGAALAALMCATSLAGSLLRGMQRVVLGVFPDLVVRYGAFAAAAGALLLARGPAAGAPAAAAAEVLRLHAVAAGTAFLVAAFFAARALPRVPLVPAPPGAPRRWLGSALGISMAGVVIIINGQIDLVMMKALATAEQTGVYAIASRLASVVLFILMASNVVLQPVIATLWTRGGAAAVERLLTRASAAMGAVGALAATFVILIRDPALATLGPGYAAASGAVVALAIANAISVAAGPVQQTLVMIGQERAFALTAMVPTIANVGLNFLLIPRYGPVGAGIATGIAIALQAVLQSAVLFLRTGIRPAFVALVTRAPNRHPGVAP